MSSADAPLALAEAGPDCSEPGSCPATLASASAAPDVADEALALHDAALDWVGMRGIDIPILFDAGDGNLQRCRARLDAFVNLVRPDRRGIHMSRLYLLANQRLGEEPVDAGMLQSLLRAFLRSHHGLADRARIQVHFEYLLRRKALRSHHHGWRAYPVSIDAALIGDAFQLELGTQVVYSSTCPASAALSRQLVQQQFAKDFPVGEPLGRAAVLAWLGSERGIIATPHAQRSLAHVRVRFVPGAPLDIACLLDRIEGSLGTAVQTAVKREDEQAFALANGENPMFCEDAARRIRRALDGDCDIAGFHVRVEHQESLHPHDAVAEVQRGSTTTMHAIGTDHGSFT
ncbi:MAG TPA: GTP cyclohydrolase FolE2 [Rhodanobacteraceae bacterium]|nr:GTP cyclohydrolase FolE2 [Rhodanobacteraceae bacterium]